MATSRSWAYLGFFLLIMSSQWLISIGDQDAQQDVTVSKQPWGPWTGIGPHPIPTQQPYPDRSRRGGGGGGISGDRGRSGGGGGGSHGESGDGGACICNCKCDCQNSECNRGGSGGGGWGGAGGGWGSGGGKGSICLPLPPMNCDGKNCYFGNGGNFARNRNANTQRHTKSMNATDTRHQ